MGWDSFGVVIFDLGLLLQGQLRIAKLISAGRQVPIFSYYFLFFNKFLFIPIFQENSYFFLFLVMIMYFKSLNVVDHMEND